MRELACGVVGWSPDAFWASTPGDLRDAVEGYLERNGAKRDALTSEDVTELRKMLDEAD